MSLNSLADFLITEELLSDQNRCVSRAEWQTRGIPVRLTVFAQQVSRHPAFRAAFKRDRGMLETLRHHSVVRFLGSGETDGRLFFWTEDCDFPSLSESLQSARPLLVEDLIEIGWQVCSALQQAHNLGLSHGGLSAENILLSTDLQVSLVDFAVHRWLRSLATTTEPQTDAAGRTLAGPATSPWRTEVERDLFDLATALLQPALRMEADAESAGMPRPTGLNSLKRMLERVQQTAESAQPVSARDMQGRLGELLIGAGKDEIELLDQREPVVTSRRSIVDELFDKPELDSHRQIPPKPSNAAETSRQMQFLPIAGLILLLVMVLLLAGLLW